MTIPVVIEQMLRSHNIDYQLLDLAPGVAEAPQPGGKVLSSLLCDGENGRLQVIHAADSLLDLAALNRLTGRDWRAVAPAEMAKLCAQHHMRQLPALPAALGVPSIVDSRLLERPALAVSSGDDQQLVQLSAEQFRRALASATVADFTRPVATLQQSLADVDDVVDITRAVASFTQLRIRQRLEETLELPPLPDTAQRILKLRVDPYADIRDLTNIVEMDPALAAQVVSWASSPYYAAPGKIKSVHDAVVRVLGFDLVLNLALGLALGKTLSLPKDAPRGFTPYWKQAIYVATSVEALVGCIPVRQRPTIGLAYLAGLLHNFGFLLLAEVFPPHFSSYCRYQEANPHLNYTLIERHLLGVDRDQMAGWLMKLWNLPEEVVLALRHQSNADYDGPAARYANLIHVAVRLLRLHGIGGTPPEPIPEALYERLSLDPSAALMAVQQVVEASAEIDGVAANLAA